MGKVFVVIAFFASLITIASACCCCDCCCCDCCCCPCCCCCCCCKKKSACPPGLILNSTRRRRAADYPKPQSLDELEANRARAVAERAGKDSSQYGSGNQGCNPDGCTLRKRGWEDGCTKCKSTQTNQNGCTMKRECHGGCRDKCARPARLRFSQHKPKDDFKWKSINELRADEYKERLRLVAEEQNAREDAENNRFAPPPPPAIIGLVSSTPWAPNVHVKELKELSYEAWSKEDEHLQAPKRNGGGKGHLQKRSEEPKAIGRIEVAENMSNRTKRHPQEFITMTLTESSNSSHSQSMVLKIPQKEVELKPKVRVHRTSGSDPIEHGFFEK